MVECYDHHDDEHIQDVYRAEHMLLRSSQAFIERMDLTQNVNEVSALESTSKDAMDCQRARGKQEKEAKGCYSRDT